MEKIEDFTRSILSTGDGNTPRRPCIQKPPIKPSESDLRRREQVQRSAANGDGGWHPKLGTVPPAC